MNDADTAQPAPPEAALPLNLHEYEGIAREKMTTGAFEYMALGSGDLAALRGNRAAFAKRRIRFRVLRGIENVDLKTTVLGQELSMPVMVSPVAFQRLCCDEGECAGAAAARTAGTVFTLSTMSTRSIEEIAPVAGPWWFQLYYKSDREISRDLIQRAEAAGASAILMTVDTPLVGNREADTRNNFTLPPGVGFANLMPYASTDLTGASGETLAAYIESLGARGLSWDDFEWVASQTKLPAGVKGLVDPEDAKIALSRGCKVIVVSNHGGRQLDHSIASLDALEDVVEAVNGACDVVLDGGIRRGTDVIKAIALGARAVMMGRPVVWGLAAHGQAGAERVLELMRAELELDMLLAGCATLADVKRSMIVDA